MYVIGGCALAARGSTAAGAATSPPADDATAVAAPLGSCGGGSIGDAAGAGAGGASALMLPLLSPRLGRRMAPEGAGANPVAAGASSLPFEDPFNESSGARARLSVRFGNVIDEADRLGAGAGASGGGGGSDAWPLAGR